MDRSERTSTLLTSILDDRTPTSVAFGRSQRATPPPLAPVGIGATVILSVLIVAAVASGLTVADAVADVEEYTDHRFVGIASTVGILLWTATATTCAFTGMVLDGTSSEDRRWRRFFFASASLAALLLVDDLLLVHELADDIALSIVDFDATRVRKNILETAVFGCYGVVALVYGWRFQQQLRQLDLRPLSLGLGLLGVSFLIDVRVHRQFGLRFPDGSDGPDLRSILEEGPKFLGIAYLAVFAALAGRQVIVSQRRGAARARPANGVTSTPAECPRHTEDRDPQPERR